MQFSIITEITSSWSQGWKSHKRGQEWATNVDAVRCACVREKAFELLKETTLEDDLEILERKGERK